ncbi:MAG: hypothetical protein QXL17_00365 [Candidatus Thermoplasmatota archaeon]
MRFEKTKITIDRELSDLDRFAIRFTEILYRHTPYVIVSGYVAILFGRARGSEDVDIIIPKLNDQKCHLLLTELLQQSYYCLNADSEKDIVESLSENLPVRFAQKDTIIPNIELKYARTLFDEIAVEKRIPVYIDTKCLFISPLELQIAFKEAVLQSPKDLEDARHMKKVAEGHIDNRLIHKFKEMLYDFYQTKPK